MSDYDAWGVVTNYIDEKKTLASIFDKLTSDGIDSLKWVKLFQESWIYTI